MEPNELLAIVQAFFQAILKIFQALGIKFGETETTTEAAAE